jgi:hypothetical protein
MHKAAHSISLCSLLDEHNSVVDGVLEVQIRKGHAHYRLAQKVPTLFQRNITNPASNFARVCNSKVSAE